MSLRLDKSLENAGTKFRLFVQPRDLTGFGTPETVRVSIPPAQMQPGPADSRFFVVDAIGKSPYDDYSRPQYQGPRNPPVVPDHDGHFDHLDLNSRDFRCATMYATVRRVLDI